MAPHRARRKEAETAKRKEAQRAIVQARARQRSAKGSRTSSSSSSTSTAERKKEERGEEEVAVRPIDAPAYWPTDVDFLATHSRPSIRLSEKHTSELCQAPCLSHDCHPWRIRAHRWTCVRPIDHRSAFVPAYQSTLTHHPAVGEHGLFAARDIPPRTPVVPYLGLVHRTPPANGKASGVDDDDDGDGDGDENGESHYDAAVEASDGTRLGIDATRCGSEARFVNDYRGILVRPNVFFHEWSAPRPTMTHDVPPKRAAAQHDHNHSRSRTNELEGRKGQAQVSVGGGGNDGDGQPSAGRTTDQVRGLALYSGAHAIKAGTEICASYGKGWWAARRRRGRRTVGGTPCGDDA